MSGQVVRADVYRKRATIDLIDAGNEQLITCAPIVYLEAIVNGDLSGHIFEWVQISGTPTVTLQQGGTLLQAYYEVGANVGTDKIFRFYIDRNTQIEQYADTLIRTTPFSTLRSVENGQLINEVPPLPFTSIEPFAITGDFPFAIFPFNAQIKQLGNDDVYVSWKLPALFYQSTTPSTDGYRQGFQGTVLQLFNGVSWTDIQFFNPTDDRQLLLTEPLRLRVGSQFKLLGKEPFIVFNPWSDVVPGGVVSILGKEVLATIEHGQLRRSITLGRIVYRLELQGYSDEILQIENGSIYNQVTLSRVVYALDQQNYTDEIPTIQHGSLKHTVTLTRVSGGVIGG